MSLRQPRRFLKTFALLLLLAVIASACMGDDGAKGEERSAADALSAAREQWDQTESAHFALKVEGDAYLDSEESIRLRSAEGDIERPDSVSATASINVAMLTVDMSLIAVGGDMYMTNFVSGRWERAPSDFSYDPSILFSDESGIGPVLDRINDAEIDGTENVNGNDTQRVTGTVDAEAVREITAGSIEGDNIAVTLWIGTDTAHIYRVKLDEPEGARAEPATWTLHLTDHDKPVSIEPPQV